MTRTRVPLLVCGLLVAVLAVEPSRAAPATLGPLLRVTTPDSTLCPAESEPEIAVTRAGTWVAFNDLGGCPLVATEASLTSLQLLPRGGGPARVVELPVLPGDDRWSGDPDLVPDPSGDGVLLSTLRFVSDAGPNVGGLRVELLRVSADGRVVVLPSPSVNGSDDKEFLAVDPRSRDVYVVWDDFTGLLLRAMRGGQWAAPATLATNGNRADVAVGPSGQVAVAYETAEGVAVRFSRDRGRTFTSPATALTGSGPGRADPSCPLRPTIGNRQRAIKSPRVAFDRAGRLHVVAALGPASAPSVAGVDGVPAEAGLLAGGQGTVLHTSSPDGELFTTPRAVAPTEAAVQWNPAVAATPDGGVAVSYLQTADGTLTTYDARLVHLPARGAPSRPLVLSDAVGELPPAQEALGAANCYGIGDYTALTPTADGVVAAWATTDGSAAGGRGGDSDIAVRTVRLR